MIDEPSPEPETPKGEAIHPLEFLIKLEEYGKTLSFSRHEEDILLSKEISLNIVPPKECVMGVKRSSKEI